MASPRGVRCVFFATLFIALSYTFLATPAVHADTQTAIDSLGAKYDSLYTSNLNNTASEDTTDASSEGSGKSAQQLFEENPHYTVRQYEHKQQVIVGSLVMFCVALAMVAMNNYNPKH